MHWFTAEERGFALGLRQASLPLGGALAAVTLPLIVVATSLQGAFLFLAALCFAAAVAGALVIRDRPGEGDAGGGGRAVDAARPPFVDPERGQRALSHGSDCDGRLPGPFSPRRPRARTERLPPCSPSRRFAIGLRIAAGHWSDRARSRVRPLRLVGLAIFTGVLLVTTLVDAPLALLIPALVVGTSLSMAWNGLSHTAAAELAGSARSGAAIGFQQTTLSVVGFLAAPLFAALVDASSRRAGWASPSGRRHRSPAGGC